MVDCEKFQEEISCLIDGELSPEELDLLHAHIAHCEDCRRMYAAFSAISTSLSEDLDEPPAELAPGIMFKIRNGAGPKRHFRHFHVGKLAALAACLAVVIFAASYFNIFRGGHVPQADSAADFAPAAEPRMAAESSMQTSGADLYDINASEPESYSDSASYAAAAEAEPPIPAPSIAPVTGSDGSASFEPMNDMPACQSLNVSRSALPPTLSLDGKSYTLSEILSMLPEQASLWEKSSQLSAANADLQSAEFSDEGEIYQSDEASSTLYIALSDGTWAVYTAS